MKKFFHAFFGLLAVAGVSLAWAQPLETQNAIHLQELRNKVIAAKKSKVYYTGERFDLDQLPHYVPELQVTGTIRIWGLNYLGDACWPTTGSRVSGNTTPG